MEHTMSPEHQLLQTLGREHNFSLISLFLKTATNYLHKIGDLVPDHVSRLKTASWPWPCAAGRTGLIG